MTLDEFLETLNDDWDVEMAQLTTFARELERHNAAMRDAIQEAGALFDDFSKACNHKDKTANAVQLEWIVSKSCAVLAKLQPFITP